MAAIFRNSSSLFRVIGFSTKPDSPIFNLSRRISTIPAHRSGIRNCCSRQFYAPSLNFSHVIGFKDNICRSGIGYRQVGVDYLRVSAVSDTSAGGNGGGGFGGSGGGSSGGNGEGGGGKKNWSLLSWYLAVLEKYPVLTKALTSAFLTFIGDVICQLAIDQVSTLDWKRTFLFTFLGFALVGPTLHFWYLYLSKLVTIPGASGAFLRLLLDQFLFSPVFIGVFLSTLMILEGKASQVVPKLQQEWFSAVVANWQLWIPFQFLNFRFVPQQFQVLAANMIALVWNVILSFKAHKEVLLK